MEGGEGWGEEMRKGHRRMTDETLLFSECLTIRKGGLKDDGCKKKRALSN